MSKGDRVVIVGDHPWSGAVGELLTWEIMPLLREKMWRVVLDDGPECYAKSINLKALPT